MALRQSPRRGGGASTPPLARLRAFLTSTLLVLAISFAIAWPVEACATKAKAASSIAAALAVAVFIVVRIAFAVRRRGPANHAARGPRRRRRAP